MNVEAKLAMMEDGTALWEKAIEMRKHRDAWRRYAYTGRKRPHDTTREHIEPIGETYIETLKKQLDDATAMIMTFIRREKAVTGSPESPFQVDNVLLCQAQAIVDKNMEHL